MDDTPPPQWASDPTGRNAQRFWDGSSWTDFVASEEGGEPAFDPIAIPAQWAADPTGRHVQRFWDGSSWTDFVATGEGGEPAIDPFVGPPEPEPIPDLPPASAAYPVAAVAPVEAVVPRRRHRVPAVAWLALAFALVGGVVLALTRGTGDSLKPSAAAVSHGSTTVPPSTTLPAAASTTTTGPARGGSTHAKGASTTTTTRPKAPGATGAGAAAAPATTSPSAKPSSIDQAKDFTQAEQVALKLTDLPPGWRTIPPGASQALDTSFRECKAFRTRLTGANADATSKYDYVKDGQRVTSSVNVLPVRSEAAAVVNMIKDPALPRCLDRAFERPARASIDNPTSQPLASLHVTAEQLAVAREGDQSAGLRFVARATFGTTTVTTYTDLIAFRVGRTAVLTTFQSSATPFDGSRDAVLTAVSSRLRGG
jgi:hypothetical protein